MGHRWQKDGSRLRTHCPFVTENTPSFVYYPHDQSFHCFSCGAHGRLKDIVARLEFPDEGPGRWRDIYQRVSDLEGTVKVHEHQPRQYVHFGSEEREALCIAHKLFRQCLKNNRPAMDYLRHRGLTNLDHLPIGYISPKAAFNLGELLQKRFGDSWPMVGKVTGLFKNGAMRCENTIWLPEIRENSVYYYQCRRLEPGEPRFFNPPGIAKTVMGTYSIKPDTKYVFVTEGPFDALSLIDNGMSAVATLGIALPQPEESYLISILKNKTAIIAMDWDGDENSKGRLAAKQLRTKLDKAHISNTFLRNPDPSIKDLSELKQKNPSIAFDYLMQFTGEQDANSVRSS